MGGLGVRGFMSTVFQIQVSPSHRHLLIGGGSTAGADGTQSSVFVNLVKGMAGTFAVFSGFKGCVGSLVYK